MVLMKRVLGGTLTIVCIIGLSIGLSLTLGVGKSIQVNCPLPEVPENVPKFKIVYRDVTSKEIKGVAENVFGLEGKVSESKDSGKEGFVSGLRIENSGEELTMLSSGAIRYTTGEEGFHYRPETLPSNENARKIAENYMEMIKESGLIPPGYEVESDGVGPGAESVMGDNGKIVHYLTVSFEVTYHGFPVETDAYVDIGENGKVLAFAGAWRRAKEDGVIDIVPPENALDRLESKVTEQVESMEQVYYILPPPYESQEELKPAYLVRMETSVGEYVYRLSADNEPIFSGGGHIK